MTTTDTDTTHATHSDTTTTNTTNTTNTTDPARLTTGDSLHLLRVVVMMQVGKG